MEKFHDKHDLQSISDEAVSTATTRGQQHDFHTNASFNSHTHTAKGDVMALHHKLLINQKFHGRCREYKYMNTGSVEYVVQYKV